MRNDTYAKGNYQASDMGYLIDEYVTGPRCERDKEILRLHFLKGKSIKEIEDELHWSKSTIQRVIQRRGDKLLLMIKN